MHSTQFEIDPQSGVVPESLVKRIKEQEAKEKEEREKGKTDKVGKLDSTGIIRLDITISHQELKLFEPPLGDGGYGIVYRGSWKEQEVAIKKLKVQTISADALKELRKEAEIMFQMGLESPYIVPVKKICLEAPHYSLVMELMPKGSLFQLLKSDQDLPWPVRYQIALDVSYGLRDLHARSILHRDLKSLNILLDDRLRAKLTDFGLSKVKQETASQSTHARGTPQWMAPELFDDEPKMTKESDIYSLGMVLWELASRQVPFTKAPNQQVVIGWIMRGKKEQIPKDCPKELSSLIESCWELPAKRPTATQVAEHVKPLLTVSDTKEKTASKPPLVPPSFADPTKVTQLQTELQQLQTTLKEQRKKQVEIEQLKRQNQAQIAALEVKLQAAVGRQRQEQIGQQKKGVERLKQQQQAELKKEPKKETRVSSLSTPVKPPNVYSAVKTAPGTALFRISSPSTPVKSLNAHSTVKTAPSTSPFMARDAARAKKQLALQDQLITACEQGDVKLVGELFKKGAKPDIADSKGKQPLGAAVWSMNPEVVNTVLKQAGGIAPLTWSQINKHNIKYYENIFIIKKHELSTASDWYYWVRSIGASPLARTYYLKTCCNKKEMNQAEWEGWLQGLSDEITTLHEWNRGIVLIEQDQYNQIERWSEGFKAQIKQDVEAASPVKPSSTAGTLITATSASLIGAMAEAAATTKEQLALQDQLITACEQGDAKAVLGLFGKGAKPNTPDSKGKQPLGAAVWSMNPEVVNEVLKQAGGSAPLTWTEVDQHNMKHYKKVFIVPDFEPRTYGEWWKLVQKIDNFSFARNFHLKSYNDLCKTTERWLDLRTMVLQSASYDHSTKVPKEYQAAVEATAEGYAGFRSQIEQDIEDASREVFRKS